MGDWKDEKIVDLLGDYINDRKRFVKEAFWAKADHQAVDQSSDYLLDTPISQLELDKILKSSDTLQNHLAKIEVDGARNAAYGIAGLADLARERYLNRGEKNEYANKAKEILGDKREYGKLGNIGVALASDLVLDTILGGLGPASKLAILATKAPARQVAKAAQAYQKLEKAPKKITRELVKAEHRMGINGMSTRHGQEQMVKEAIPGTGKAAVAYGNAKAGDKPDYEKNRDFLTTLLAEIGLNSFAKRYLGHRTFGSSRITRATGKMIADSIISEAENEATDSAGKVVNAKAKDKEQKPKETHRMTRAEAMKFKGPMDEFYYDPLL